MDKSVNNSSILCDLRNFHWHSLILFSAYMGLIQLIGCQSSVNKYLFKWSEIELRFHCILSTSTLSFSWHDTSPPIQMLQIRISGRWLPERGSRLIVSEARTQANHSDTAQMTAGYIVDEVGKPPARPPASRSRVSPQHRAAAVLSTGRFTARPKSGRWRQRPGFIIQLSGYTTPSCALCHLCSDLD